MSPSIKKSEHCEVTWATKSCHIVVKLFKS